MQHLLNLFAAIALLVWGTQTVRTGILRVLGEGLRAVLRRAVRRVPLGNLIVKAIGCTLACVAVGVVGRVTGAGPSDWLADIATLMPTPLSAVVGFHLAFNLALSLLFIAFTRPQGRALDRWLPVPAKAPAYNRPHHLDPTALATPSLAISCAAREALHQADVVETMLQGLITVIKTKNLALSEQLRKSDDTVDELYSAIKFYLTQISREALSEREGRRWTDIVSFTINMEQIGDTRFWKRPVPCAKPV
jgi:phosphate:Na+ symporter